VPDWLVAFRRTARKPTRRFDNLQPVSCDPYSSESEQQFQRLKRCTLVGSRLFVDRFAVVHHSFLKLTRQQSRYRLYRYLESRFMSLAPAGGQMSKTVTSPLQKKLAAMLVEQRKKAGLRQVDLAKKIGVYQSWVTHMESGQRRIDVVELIELSRAIGFVAADMVRKLSRR
jgi:DNA-binding XRE family transcriptional regulator